MADITTELNAIESAARGEEVRDSIIDAFNKLNDDGIDNCLSLDGHLASYFATAENLGNLIPTPALVYINPGDWDNGVYSFESQFPSDTYDIYIQPGPGTTEDQLYDIADAGIVVGSETLNTIRCVGTVPVNTIQLMVLAVKKPTS